MRGLLKAYLSEVERGLRGIPLRRKRLFLKELETHLLDEAEERGITDDQGMEALLAEKEPPLETAQQLCLEEDQETTHRTEVSLASGALLGTATGGLLWFQDFPLYLAIPFGVAHGLAVGGGLFWLRHRWQNLSADGRLAAATLLGALLATPLGFTRFFHGQGFILSRLYYGAFTGFLVERHHQRRPLWEAALEVLAFTAFMLVVEFPLTQRLRHFGPSQVRKELLFNAILALAVLGAQHLRRALSARYILPRGGGPENLP